MSKYYCLKEAPRLVKLGSSDSFQLDLHCFLYMARKGGEGEEGSGSPGKRMRYSNSSTIAH